MWKNILYNNNDSELNNKSLKYKFQLINSILLIATFSSFLMTFLFMFIGKSEVGTFLIILEFIFGCWNMVLFFFLRYNKNNLREVIYVGMLSLYLLQVIIMINNTDDSFREAWYFITVIASFFLAGKKFGYFIFSLILITITIYNFQPFIETKLNIFESSLSIILLILVGLLINLYEKTKENYANSLKDTNLALENKIEELNQFNTNLEDKIQEEIDKNLQHELKLSEQSKMVAMGEMIGNIAHQWRQPLSAISTISTGSKMQMELNLLTNEMFNKNMDIINDNVQYLSETINDFRNFVKGDRVKKLFNLSKEIDSFLHLIEGSVKSHYIIINLDLNDDIQINGYANELIQCFINIFNNSKDALEEFEEEDRLIFIKTYLENKKAIITFKDSAGGISKEVLPKIFDPYFTTKHQSQGTGLGLHMTYKLIVNGMDGLIESENIDFVHKNKEYRGAEFKISLDL